ncbi:MAG: type I restriction-modification system subunit M [Endomicrobiaceae bacterium]|nr:type I restriction-modification system subunit M [Endomicrobiaceae bacterium]
MATKKSEIYSSLWASCDELRGGMDASQYKDYILTLLFVKYVSDKFKGKGKFTDITIPKEGGSFDDIVALKGNKHIGEGIDKIISKLAQANNLQGIIDNARFNDQTKIGKGQEMVDKLTKIVAIFQRPELDFKNNHASGDDILGDAYEYLMRNFATESGKSKGQFYTPAEVSRILAKIIGIDKARNDQTAYDPACGSGSLLIKVADESPCKISIYGQEKETTTAGLAKMNFVLHNRADGEIRTDNTFASPQYFENDEHTTLKRFDYVVANPPFSLKNWASGLTGHEYGRFDSYESMPPEKNGDYAWILHIIKSMKSNGKAAVILPHGVLFRGNAESTIRKNIIDKGYIKGIIGLPSNLFYGTGIPACILVLDKERANMRKGLFMIDASHDYIKDGNKNRLRERDIYKIVTNFNGMKKENGYSRMVMLDEIKKNNYNLNIPRYIDGGTKDVIQDINAHLNGGIPVVDIDGLQRYWGEFKGLKEKIFDTFCKDYYKLNLKKDTIRNIIYDDAAFKNYGKKIERAYTKWKTTSDRLFFNLQSKTKPNELIVKIAEEIIAEFEDVKLIDKYDVYEELLSYWQTVMADDVYLVIKDGYETGREIDIFYKKTKKQDDSVTRKENGWDGKIIPKDLIIKEFFAEEKLAVDEAQSVINEEKSKIDEILDEYGGDEGLLKDFFNSKGEIIKSEIEKSVKQAKKNKETDTEDFAIWIRYLKISNTLSEKEKLVRILIQQLDDKAKVKYANLTVKQIKELLINRKWHTQIYNDINSLYKTVSQHISEHILEIVERYENTLPELETAVENYEIKVKKHLEKMGFVW